MQKTNRFIGGFLTAVLLVSNVALTSNAAAFSKDEAGTTGAQFLKIGCGARAIGMGEAFSAVSDDASAIYWNPAGLAQLKKAEISTMHAVWLEEINYSFFAFAKPIPSGVVAVSVNYLAMTKMDKYNEFGDLDGTFAPYDAAINIAYAREYSKTHKIGANIKYIRQEIDGTTASGYAADLGLLSLIPKRHMKVAFVVQNIGTKMKFVAEEFNLPLTLRLGVSSFAHKSMTLAADIVAPIDNDPSLQLGGEYRLKATTNLPLALRLGYKTSAMSNLDSLGGLSVGFGFNTGSLALDYAWVLYGNLGSTHRLSLGFRFGDASKGMTNNKTKNQSGWEK